MPSDTASFLVCLASSIRFDKRIGRCGSLWGVDREHVYGCDNLRSGAGKGLPCSAALRNTAIPVSNSYRDPPLQIACAVRASYLLLM